ncbi:methylaspartate mutase subunit E [Acetomicrobium sp. UBA5826]|uniref:methylaspartate mutase subunit E n=1 Tax=Acetomicrobium sp. UBA5826 TaxID=1946039 RepID=UPI00257A60F8|nr:methylaspartate mutase subunit E [Acetomicrobium sp. UBA5826]
MKDLQLVLKNEKWDEEEFLRSRPEVLKMWATGAEVDLDEAVAYHLSMPKMKNTGRLLKKAKDEGRTLVAFRGGVATVEGQIELLQYLQNAGADLLPATVDSYTRNLRFHEAQQALEQSYAEGRSLLNGFPAVNHGVKGCRKLCEAVDLPITCKHGSVDGRILAEIVFAGGMTDYNGGGICFNVVYSKDVPLEVSIKNWQYVDRLIGYYADRGVVLHREESGALTGTLVPPSVSLSVGIIEALLAAEQGVPNMCISYGQGGNLIQDIAAIRMLNELGQEYLNKFEYSMVLTSKFDQWMGAFPHDEQAAYGVIVLGAATAALGGAQQTIVKSPQEAMGIPTKEANAGGIKATKQTIGMLINQRMPIDSQKLKDEIYMIKRETHAIIDKVIELGSGDLAIGVVRAFESGVLDVPFAPSVRNAGKVMPVRDAEGALRYLDAGNLPFDKEILEFHREKIAEREKRENHKVDYNTVIRDVYSVSRGKLV